MSTPAHPQCMARKPIPIDSARKGQKPKRKKARIPAAVKRLEKEAAKIKAGYDSRTEEEIRAQVAGAVGVGLYEVPENHQGRSRRARSWPFGLAIIAVAGALMWMATLVA